MGWRPKEELSIQAGAGMGVRLYDRDVLSKEAMPEESER